MLHMLDSACSNVKQNWGNQKLRVQEQPFADILQNRCCEKFDNVHRKAPVLESLFNKVAGFKAWNFIKNILQQRYIIYFYIGGQIGYSKLKYFNPK